MEIRPKIKISLSQLDKTLELISAILLVVMLAFTAYVFIKLPATIPIHYNATGKVDNYGNKTTLLILPVLATVIYFGLTQLNKYPHIFNYLKKITEENAQKQYTISTRMLRYLKLAMLIIFTLIILFIYLTTIGVTKGPGIWFLPLAFALLLIPIVISIIQSLKKK